VKVPLKKSELRLNPPALNLFKKMVEAAAYGCESVKDPEGVKPEYAHQLPGRSRIVLASQLFKGCCLVCMH
jgi:hypothetical protein